MKKATAKIFFRRESSKQTKQKNPSMFWKQNSKEKKPANQNLIREMAFQIVCDRLKIFFYKMLKHRIQDSKTATKAQKRQEKKERQAKKEKEYKENMARMKHIKEEELMAKMEELKSGMNLKTFRS